MNWHEDFDDEPAVEERMPFGVSPVEAISIWAEVHRLDHIRNSRLHEDFGDEPAVEERRPFGVSPEEMHEVSAAIATSESSVAPRPAVLVLPLSSSALAAV